MAAPVLFLSRDARILEMIRKGDEEALVILFRETRPLVRDFIRKNNGSSDDADDALQDALIILWERVRAGRFEQTAKLSTFLVSVVRNRWLRVLAGRRRESPIDMADEPESDDETPEEQAVRSEERRLVQQAMASLDEGCRRLLTLYYWDECSMEEIAAAMGFANAATAKSKKYQCKKNLEKILRGLPLRER